MAIVVVDSGEVAALNYLVGKLTNSGSGTAYSPVYRLYTNNITPAETDSAGTYSEASGGGYASKTLTGANWTVTSGAPTTASYADAQWIFTGALAGNATVYGYYVTRSSDGVLLWAENFAAFTPAQSGDNITIQPRITAT